MLHDQERLTELLLDPERPVQIVIAGKAHPADDGGKRLIQQMVKFADDPPGPAPDRVPAGLRHGPGARPGAGLRRVAEQPAAAAGGVRHLGHEVGAERRAQPVDPGRLVGRVVRRRERLGHPVRGRRGAIRRAATSSRPPRCTTCSASRSRRCSTTRRRPACPRRWLEMVAHTLRTLGPKAQATRMVREYVTELYLPAARGLPGAGQHGRPARSDGGRPEYGPARELAAWKRPGPQGLAGRPRSSTSRRPTASRCRAPGWSVSAVVALGELSPDDVTVEVVYGRVGDEDEIVEPAQPRWPWRARRTASRPPATPARPSWAAPGRSATRSGCCPRTRCWPLRPSWAWLRSRMRPPA